MGELVVWLFTWFRNSVPVPAFTSSVQDGHLQCARWPAILLANSLRIIAKATAWSSGVFTNLDPQPLPPIPHGLVDFACATFELRKTSVSRLELAS